ncbi:hypothetical protein Tco_0881815 [Tanacetum coccineum]
MNEELTNSYRILEKRLFHEGRTVTPSFISENNMLRFFQAIGFEPFLTLNEPICPRFVSLNSLYNHPNSNYFGPKHDIVKRAITTPRTTQDQLLRDPNKLYIDDIHPDLKGWGLFFKENFFCSIDKRNKVKACTAYMLYYLTIGRKFNFTSMIIYRIEEVIKKHKGPMPFAMLLTRLYNHILDTNPQAIVPIARKGKEASPPIISSSSSSSDDNEAPSFLEFYDELSDSEDLTKAQREKRGMFKCLNQYVGTITKYMEKQK